MRTIIKLPPQSTYQTECYHCLCEFTYQDEDLHDIKDDERPGRYVECPNCNGHVIHSSSNRIKSEDEVDRIVKIIIKTDLYREDLFQFMTLDELHRKCDEISKRMDKPRTSDEVEGFQWLNTQVHTLFNKTLKVCRNGLDNKVVIEHEDNQSYEI